MWWPKRTGRVVEEKSASAAPPLSITPCAVLWSVTAQSGNFRPNTESQNLRKYCDQLAATAMLPTAYSRMRSQPMIQATISPSVA